MLRGRALFALRNKGGPAEVEALDASLAGNSALLKHEVAYVLGQMQDAAAIGALECGRQTPALQSCPLQPQPALARTWMQHVLTASVCLFPVWDVGCM